MQTCVTVLSRGKDWSCKRVSLCSLAERIGHANVRHCALSRKGVVMQTCVTVLSRGKDWSCKRVSLCSLAERIGHANVYHCNVVDVMQ